MIRKENRKKRQRIGASLRGADPKSFRNDSTDSSSEEDGDSATRSSYDEDSPTTEETVEPVDGQEPAGTESETIFHIPESIKQFLEEDCINIQCHKKVLFCY